MAKAPVKTSAPAATPASTAIAAMVAKGMNPAFAAAIVKNKAKGKKKKKAAK